MNQYSRYTNTNLACVVKEGEVYYHMILKFVILRRRKCFNSFIEGDHCNEGETFGVKSKREKLYAKGSLVLKFHYAMTCCVAINAKEGDCWI